MAAAGMAGAAEAWALGLTARPSVNGTAGEAAFGPWLRERLAGLQAVDRAWTVPVPGDPLGRAAAVALARGRGSAAVLLTGHFDTVRVDDYGDLAPLATWPEPLRAALLDRLAAGPTSPAERQALADLRGGDFLPGRGLLDMKAGLAAGLAALEAWAADPDRQGNVLFAAVPDEEANSGGARALARRLPDDLKALGLELVAAVNLDALLAEGDGADGRCVAMGTVGKLLPSALVVGRPTHAAATLAGVNAGALAAAVAAGLEWAPELADRCGGEVAAPPTLLGISDHRPGYDVTTPERVWAYWNVMTLERGPAEVLDAILALVREAADGWLGRLRGRGGEALPERVPVLSFAELRDRAGAGAAGAAARDAAGLGLDLPEQCRRITEALWARAGLPGPAVVVGFASMPYLPASLSGQAGARVGAAVRRAAADVGARAGVAIGYRGRFPGISDVSFLGQVDAAGLPAIAANTPAWGHGLDWPDGPPSLGAPTVNIGPWGRDYHTPLERLHAPYAFGVLPELLLASVRELLR